MNRYEAAGRVRAAHEKLKAALAWIDSIADDVDMEWPKLEVTGRETLRECLGSLREAVIALEPVLAEVQPQEDGGT